MASRQNIGSKSAEYRLVLSLVLAVLQLFCYGQSSHTDKEIERIIKQLSVEEKIKLFHGYFSDSIPQRFESGGVKRLGIPVIKMLDGPVGLRDFEPEIPTTALPSTLSLSCTWDTLAVRTYAKVLAEEMASLNKQVLYGPGINLMRSPLGGRNFEYMGEDPLLTANLAMVYIDELQRHNIAGCAKHYVANDIDHLRHFVSSRLDERTLREIHLYPFEKVTKEASVWAIMVGNNLVNGKHVSENSHLIHDILRDELKYDGVLISDWRAAYEAAESFEGGLDMSMGFCAYVYGEGHLLSLVKSGIITEEEIDERLHYILKLYQRTGLLSKEQKSNPYRVNTDEHKKAALDLASQGMVLLKNENERLPLIPSRIEKIIVSGPAYNKVAYGKGSSRVKPEIFHTPVEGLQELYGEEKIIFIEDIDLLDKTTLDSYASNNYPVLFFAEGPESGEGRDLKDLDLVDEQHKTIQKWGNFFSVAVVVQSASAFNTDGWSKSADAILCSWYSGQSTGHAIASVISGDINPSGKLSFTLAKDLQHYAPHAMENWVPYAVIATPPMKASFKPEERSAIHGYSTDYDEGVLQGYRWFDAKNIVPEYEFGFGLSYSSFSFSDLKLTVGSLDLENPEIIVKGKIKNTGKKAGAEVIQVYVGDIESTILRPPKELKAFTKIYLKPGETKEYSFTLGKEAFQFWDELHHEWNIEKGKFIISIATSSRQIHAQEWLDFR